MKLKKKQQQFLIDAHKEVCQEWKTKLENNFPKLFQKVAFEVGKWYIKDVGVKSLFVWSGNNNLNYGFFGGEWGECWSMNFPKVWRPATDKEVEEALIKEAKRRGLEHGNFECLFMVTNPYTDGEPQYDFDPFFNRLGIYRNVCFDNGKWAEVIETITKEEAEKELGKKIVC